MAKGKQQQASTTSASLGAGASQGKKKAVSASDVLWYYPNIIGYLRVFFMLATFYFYKTQWIVATLCYFLAFMGDSLDGYVARKFQQTSKFGGILDMVTDRVSTAGLLVILSHLHPEQTFIFILLIVVDIFSHWFHVNSVTAHHKSKEALQNRNILIRVYYENYNFFVYCIAGTEAFYGLLYIAHHNSHLTFLPYLNWALFGPACVLKQLINVAQLFSACHAIADYDADEKNNDNSEESKKK